MNQRRSVGVGTFADFCLRPYTSSTPDRSQTSPAERKNKTTQVEPFITSFSRCRCCCALTDCCWLLLDKLRSRLVRSSVRRSFLLLNGYCLLHSVPNKCMKGRAQVSTRSLQKRPKRRLRRRCPFWTTSVEGAGQVGSILFYASRITLFACKCA